MKNFIILVALVIGLGLSHQSKGQIVPSIRVSTISADLDWTPEFGNTLNNVLQINSIGIGPSISAETKRLTFQVAVLKHFNSSGGSLINADNDTGSLRRIPNEFNFTLGYKINANRKVQIYPFATFGRYNLRVETTETINSNTSVDIDTIILNQIGGGLGAQYDVNKLKFDIQVKAKSNSGSFQGGRYSGPDVSVSFGVGYIL